MQAVRLSGGDRASRSLFRVARRNRRPDQTQPGILCRRSSGSDVSSGIRISVLIVSKFSGDTDTFSLTLGERADKSRKFAELS